MIKKISFLAAALTLPVIAFGQTGPSASFGQIGATVSSVINFINSYLVPLVFALAFLMFIWGMFKFFLLSGSSEDGRKNGQQLMLWGVVAFVMMVSIWGLVNVVAQGLGFRSQNIQDIPNTPRPR